MAKYIFIRLFPNKQNVSKVDDSPTVQGVTGSSLQDSRNGSNWFSLSPFLRIVHRMV